jgi:gamma-tubulin complex component 3
MTVAGAAATGPHDDGLGIHADEQYFLRDAFQDIHPQDIAEALRALRYAGDLPLSTFVHRLSYQIDTRLLQLLEQRFHYRQHLAALKRFLLLGQGDFVMCLMDGVGPELKKRANQLFRHNLTAILEGALRASNAQYDPPYILDRVHVRLLDAAPGDTGWEVFALDYSVDMPLHAIVHPEALQQYRVAFHMLWRLKRVEWSLTTTWKSFLSFAHSHEWKTHQLSSSKLRKLPSLVEVRSIFHRCNLHRAKMMHLVNNFSAFVMFEVLESSWVTLEKSLHQAQSLDQVIDAHDQYLHDILDKALLSPKHETLHMMIQALLQTILRFCSLEETLVAGKCCRCGGWGCVVVCVACGNERWCVVCRCDGPGGATKDVTCGGRRVLGRIGRDRWRSGWYFR